MPLPRDPWQFVSQIGGRLLPYREVPAIEEFIKHADEGTRTLSLRPLKPALHPPGTALLRTLEGHSWRVNDVALNREGWLAVSVASDGARDNTLKVWDLRSGSELFTLAGHTGWVSTVAVTTDGHRTAFPRCSTCAIRAQS